MQLEMGAKPFYSPISVTNPSKESHAKKLARIEKALKTGFWANPSQKVKLYDEVPVPVNNSNRRFDYVATSRPKLDRDSIMSWRGDLVQTIGFELKSSLSDLKQDVKFIHYIGFVDFMYFIVPSELVKVAEAKLVPFPNIGIIDITKNEIVRDAFMSLVSDEKRRQLFEQLQFLSIP